VDKLLERYGYVVLHCKDEDVRACRECLQWTHKGQEWQHEVGCVLGLAHQEVVNALD
jgi:hypothetical protein